jgi:hypothetical protein
MYLCSVSDGWRYTSITYVLNIIIFKELNLLFLQLLVLYNTRKPILSMCFIYPTRTTFTPSCQIALFSRRLPPPYPLPTTHHTSRHSHVGPPSQRLPPCGYRVSQWFTMWFTAVRRHIPPWSPVADPASPARASRPIPIAMPLHVPAFMSASDTFDPDYRCIAFFTKIPWFN